MKSTAKAEALLRDVADKLKVRLAANATVNTVRQAKDANGWPMLFLSAGGNEAAGQPVIGIRITAVNAVSKDVFGNDLIAFAPHNLEIAYELTAVDNPVPTDVSLFIAWYEAQKTGVQMQLKELANGTAVTEASMNAAAAAITLDELYWPTKGV